MLAENITLGGGSTGLPVATFVKASFDARGTRYVCTNDDSLSIFVGKIETKRKQMRIQAKLVAEQETVSASGAVGNTLATGSVVLTDFPIASDETKARVLGYTLDLSDKIKDMVPQVRRGEQ